MRTFKTKRKNKKYIQVMLISIVILTSILINYYGTNISKKIELIAQEKLEEISILYIKKDITPDNIELNELIKINLNEKQEIIYTDIDMDYARKVMVDIVGKIQNNIYKLESGNISNFKNANELKSNDGNLYLLVPLMLYTDNVLVQNLGPKVPIKLSFYENVFGDIKTNITEYGINNALITIELTIELEQKIIIPYKEKEYKRVFSIPLGSKVINGKVPNIYGNGLTNTTGKLEV